MLFVTDAYKWGRDFKSNCTVMETLTGSPWRPLGPTSPSSPWKHIHRKPHAEYGKMLIVNSYGVTQRQDVLSIVWNYFKFFCHIFVPFLRPPLELLGVLMGLSHPEEWKCEGLNHLLRTPYIKKFIRCWLLFQTHPVSFVAGQTWKSVKTTVTLRGTNRHGRCHHCDEGMQPMWSWVWMLVMHIALCSLGPEEAWAADVDNFSPRTSYHTRSYISAFTM